MSPSGCVESGISEEQSGEDMAAEAGVESVVDMANRWMFGDGG